MEGGTVKTIFRIQLSYLVVFVQMARVFHLWSKGGLVTGALKWHLVDLGSASCVLKLLMALEKAFEVLLCFISLCLYVKQKKKKSQNHMHIQHILGNFLFTMFHFLLAFSSVNITKDTFGFHASVEMKVLNK